MKLMTALAVASLAIAGVACSESEGKTSPEGTDKVAVEAQTGGTLNLSLPSSLSEPESQTGTLNLNIGGAMSDEPRMIGADQLNSVDFGEVPGPAFDAETDEPPAASDDDGIIRLDPN